MAIIVPCAGKSSRYPNTRPKYLLTMFNGNFMFQEAILSYVATETIYIVILKEHDIEYGVSNIVNTIYKDFPNVKLCILENETSGPAETVYMVSKDLPEDEPIFIKDCDSFFEAPVRVDNHVCVADLRDNLNVSKVAAKSFAVVNDQDMLVNIFEKTVSSNYICVGGYGFTRAKDFNETFKKLKDQPGELFVSHIIKSLIDTMPFEIQKVQQYVDVGTYDEFIDYNQSKTLIFCDIDGTVFYNQSKFFKNNYNNKPVPIENAVKYLLNKQKAGSKIIFVTSRPKTVEDITRSSLIECGFVNFEILFDMPHSPRVIINDNSITNPYPTAISINVPRDDNNYWKQLN